MWEAVRHARTVAYRQLAPNIQLVYAFMVFAGAYKDKEVPSLLEFMRRSYPWAVPVSFEEVAQSAEQTEELYSALVVQDVELAWELGVLSQDDLVFLGNAKLRRSGAWKK